MRHRVFISHCEKDQVAAHDLCHRIERRGVKCWIAPRDIAVGEDFSGRVVEAIEMSAVFVIVLSRHTNSSQFVKAEAEAAFTSKRLIFPIRLENVEAEKGLRLFISIRHRADAFGPGRAQAIDKFVDAVVRRAIGSKVPPKPDNLPVRSDLVQLIGPGAMDFLAQWREMDRRGARMVWNWEAFLGGAAWPFYRGLMALGIGLMLVLALAVLIGGMASRSADGALIGFALGWVGAAIYAGLTGSVVLRRHVHRRDALKRQTSGPMRLGGLVGGVAAIALAFAITAQPAPMQAATTAGVAIAPKADTASTGGAATTTIAPRRDGSPDLVAAERLQREEVARQVEEQRLRDQAAAQELQKANYGSYGNAAEDMTITENRM